jgi:hypothetical protein
MNAMLLKRGFRVRETGFRGKRPIFSKGMKQGFEDGGQPRRRSMVNGIGKRDLLEKWIIRKHKEIDRKRKRIS